MNYVDRIYGNIEIDEPVILDIINSSDFQRLKGIDLGGYIEPYFPGGAQSRYEHSVGVFILLKKYGAGIEELIAGLVHDISHSAFSHCIDYVLSEGSESKHDLQDNIFVNFLKKTELPAILKKHNFSFEYIVEDKNFPLKEQTLPALCADRIDYSLRSAVVFKEIMAFEAKKILAHLVVKDNKWIFSDSSYAKIFAELFLKLNNEYFSGILSAIMFRTVGDYLKLGLQRGYISREALYSTDREVLTILAQHHSDDPLLFELFNRMDRKISCKNVFDDYDAQVKCKSRMVDPLCFYKGDIVNISDIDPVLRRAVQIESKPKEYFLKFNA